MNVNSLFSPFNLFFKKKKDFFVCSPGISIGYPNDFTLIVDKTNKLDVGNAVNPKPSEDDKKLAVVKSPNAVNPLVWDYYVSIKSLGSQLALLQ